MQMRNAKSILLLPIILGCSSDSTGVGVPSSGFVEAFVQDDPQASTPQAGAALAGADDAFTGTLVGEMGVSIRSIDGTWFDLGGRNQITMALQTTGRTAISARLSAPIGTYTGIRLVLYNLLITVDGGSRIGSVDVPSPIQATGATFLPVAVELSVSAFTVSGSGTAELVFDLNAEEWIGLGELSSGLISDVNMASRIRGRATSG